MGKVEGKIATGRTQFNVAAAVQKFESHFGLNRIAQS